jgi:hypothetical protein
MELEPLPLASWPLAATNTPGVDVTTLLFETIGLLPFSPI